MKEFSTHRQQLNILRQRGLDLPPGTSASTRALRILERENYYTVVNGYKFIFLDESREEERFKQGTTFDEIYTLYQMDRAIRNCLLEFLLIFEANIKTKIAYRFSEKYKGQHDYLIFRNYTSDPFKSKEVLGVIANLSNTLKSKSKNKIVKHYLDKYGHVPLWVLVKYLTFGNLNYMYNNYNEKLRNQIASDFSRDYKNQYKEEIHITPNILDNIFKSANFYRNICAHEEVLYSYKIKNKAKTSQIANILQIDSALIGEGNLFSMIVMLKLVLTKNEFKEFINKLQLIFKNYKGKIKTIEQDEIMLQMGFVGNWNDII